MQITATPTHLGRITFQHRVSQSETPRPIIDTDLVAGATLVRGVRDVYRAYWDLKLADRGDGMPSGWGLGSLVGFVRRGEVWDGVELLAATPDGPQRIQDRFDLRALSVDAGVDLRIFEMGDYGSEVPTTRGEA